LGGPQGKITLWIWGSLINYSAHYTFRNIGDEYAGPDYAYLRMCPAFFSALVPPMAYLALSEGGLSAAGALAGASFVLWDNCIVGEGKFILVDSQLFFWSTAAVYCYLRAKFRTRLVFRADGTLSLAANAEFVKWHLAAGVTMFLALSIKWTALGLVGVVGIDVAVRLLIDLRDGARLELWIKEFLLKLVLLLVIPLGVYFLMFAIHFWLLPLSGDGDVFMTREFKARLVGAKGVPAGTVPKGLLASIFELQRTMFVSNEGLAATHTWGSTWDQWPFMAGKGVLYWTHPNTMIYLLGNPLVWWGSTVAVFAFITMMLWPAVEAFTGGRGAAAAGGYAALPSSVHDDSSDAGAKGSGGAPRLRLVERVRRARIRSLGVFFLSGYMANLLPYMLIRRVCFVYHYIPALIQGSLLAAVVLEICTFDKPRVRMGIAMGIFALQGLVFYKFSPWTYGFHTNNEALRWRSTWT
jgi:dolichyl-phosphate-mannose--protein O-mannosyl transferase